MLAAVYLPDELVAHALATTTLSPGITIRVHDGEETSDASQLYATPAAGDLETEFHEIQRLDVAGRPWTLAARATPGFDGGATARGLPAFVLGASLLTGLALAAMLFVLATAHDRARALASRMTAALEEQRALQLRSDRLRSLGEMAAGMAHELNQPLQGVRGQAEHAALAMARGWAIAPERLLGMLQAIIAQADRMTHIIDHVRLFAREAGRPQVTSVDLAEVAASAIGMVGAQIRAKGIELVQVPTPTPVPPVRGNAFSLEEVVLNLLTNARDAVEDRRRQAPELPGPHITVHVAAVPATGPATRVRLRVEDRGGGMPAAVAARAFEPFFTTKGPDRGTGLGLSIARALVEEVGGTITLDSTADGTAVTIEFPAATPPETTR